jgi:hypothetical protein
MKTELKVANNKNRCKKNRVSNINYTEMLSICAIVRDKFVFFNGTRHGFGMKQIRKFLLLKAIESLINSYQNTFSSTFLCPVCSFL